MKWNRRRGVKKAEVIRTEELERLKDNSTTRKGNWHRGKQSAVLKSSQRGRGGCMTEGWKASWQRREADRDTRWQRNRKMMADGFNEVSLDVILSCNYSALLFAWLYMQACAASNSPAEAAAADWLPWLFISRWPKLEPEDSSLSEPQDMRLLCALPPGER